MGIINYNGDHQDEIIPYVRNGAYNDIDMVNAMNLQAFLFICDNLTNLMTRTLLILIFNLIFNLFCVILVLFKTFI